MLIDSGAISYGSPPAGTTPIWLPIPDFNLSNADVSAFFLLSTDIIYTAPVYDPMYNATTAVTVLIDGAIVTIYQPFLPLRLIACTDQFQICKPDAVANSTTGCTPLSGYYQLENLTDSLSLNPTQKETVKLLVSSVDNQNLYGSVLPIGVDALIASQYTNGLASAPLPNNQYQIEFSSWFAVALARLQIAVVEYSTGPTNQQDLDALVRPNTTEGKNLCRSILVQSTGNFQNFSVLGIAIIIAVGGVIILLGASIDTIVGWLQSKNNPRRLQWRADSKFQIQRMAYEGAGWGPWENCDGTIPYIATNMHLGLVDTTSIDHPTIKRAETDSTTASPVALRQKSTDEERDASDSS
jgi:hypothetical protein